MTRFSEEEFEIWIDYEIGKPCLYHPNNIIKRGKYGNWCGSKDKFGRWCSGSMPTEEFLTNLRKKKS